MEKGYWQNKWMDNMAQWANAKIYEENIALLKQIKISKEDMENCNWVMFTHVMDLFKEHMSLKKPIPKQIFTSLLNNLLTEDLVTLGNLLST